MRFTFLLCLFVLMGCASNAPPTVSPRATRIHQANEAVIAIGSVWDVAKGLNGVIRCEPPPSTVCAPVLSDRNTGIVADAVADAVTTITTVPAGWKATALAAVERIAMRLDAAGQAKLAAYLQAARVVVGAL